MRRKCGTAAASQFLFLLWCLIRGAVYDPFWELVRIAWAFGFADCHDFGRFLFGLAEQRFRLARCLAGIFSASRVSLSYSDSLRRSKWRRSSGVFVLVTGHLFPGSR